MDTRWIWVWVRGRYLSSGYGTGSYYLYPTHPIDIPTTN